jgi:hypothetical protein
MHLNEQLIQKFYSSFQKRDANGMISCYHSQIVFSDPVFGRLDSAHAVAMWQMLCGRAKNLEIVCSHVHAGNESGSAHWEARYTFGKSQRAVHNIIDATYEFRDGLIVKHADTFDLWRWSRMALGPIGIVLGWTPMIQAAIRKDARRGLDEFIAKQPQ